MHHVNARVYIFKRALDAELDFSIGNALDSSCHARVLVFVEAWVFGEVFVEAFFVFFLGGVGGERWGPEIYRASF